MKQHESAVDTLLKTLRTALGRTQTSPPPPLPSVPDDLRSAVSSPDLLEAFRTSALKNGSELAAALPDLLTSDVDVAADPFALTRTTVRARAAIACSGSVLIDAEPALPIMSTPLLIVQLDPRAIVANLRDALAAHPPTRTRVIVTGPSKTADIEGILITGVHGPGRVVIAID